MPSKTGVAHLIDQAVRRYEIEAQARRQLTEIQLPQPPRVVTISRLLGTGGRRVAETLAASLGWPLWDKEILDALAEQSHGRYQADMFRALDERTRDEIDTLTRDLFGRPTTHDFLYYLVRAVTIVARNNAILLGRGADLILPDALHVRIDAPLEARIENLVRHERMTRPEAEKAIKQSDQHRVAFRDELARKLGRHSRYDLTLDTGTFTIDQAASLIRYALELTAPNSRVGQATPPVNRDLGDG